MPSLTVNLTGLPLRTSSTGNLSPGFLAWIALIRSAYLAIGFPLALVITSPAFNPAFSDGPDVVIRSSRAPPSASPPVIPMNTRLNGPRPRPPVPGRPVSFTSTSPGFRSRLPLTGFTVKTTESPGFFFRKTVNNPSNPPIASPSTADTRSPTNSPALAAGLSEYTWTTLNVSPSASPTTPRKADIGAGPLPMFSQSTNA